MKVLLFLLLFLLVNSSANAQEKYLEVQNQFDKNWGYAGEGRAWIPVKVAGPVGVFFWGLGSSSWSEAVGGITLAPASWIELDLGAGVETDPNPWRVLGVLWLGSDKVSLLNAFETGGSGFLYDIELNITVSEHANFGVGAMAQKFSGIGPRIQFDVGHTGLMVWASPIMWDLDDHSARNTLLGTRFSF